jgi:hypothetical protein
VNKRVDGQRKRKLEKKHKGEKESKNGKVKGQKEKRKRESYRENNDKGEIGD